MSRCDVIQHIRISQDLMQFANGVQDRLAANAHKGDAWKTCRLVDLRDKIQEEYEEVIDEYAYGHDPTEMRKELEDLAAVAMFLWHRYAPDPPSEVEERSRTRSGPP